jgi:hypothetical protein
MQELIDRLVTDAGITAEQAQKSIEVIKKFVTEKFPMLGGAVESMLGADMGNSDDGLDR